MNVTIVGRKVHLKENFKNLVERKLSKFDKIFGTDAEAHVTVTVEKNRQKVEVTIKQNGMFYRAESTTLEMNESLDEVIDILSGQIRKNKSKLEKRLRAGNIGDYVLDEISNHEDEKEEFKILRSKHFPVKPLDIQEAILQMNMIGHQFYMFRNADSGEVNVVYCRKNGSYGLLEPDPE